MVPAVDDDDVPTAEAGPVEVDGTGDWRVGETPCILMWASSAFLELYVSEQMVHL